MQLEYSLTLDDLREAFSSTANRRHTWINLGCWCVLFACATFFAVESSGDDVRAQFFHEPMPPEQNLWFTLVPALVGVTLVVGNAVLHRVRSRRGAGNSRSSNGPLLVQLLAVAWVGVAAVPALAIAWHPSASRLLWAAVAPWFAYLAMAAGLALTFNRHMASVLWATQRSLHRPSVVTFGDDGITLTDPLVEQRYRWPHIVRYRETANLLLLATEDTAQLILPKRAMTSPGAEQALRAIVQTHVAEGQFLPRDARFPMVAVAQ